MLWAIWQINFSLSLFCTDLIVWIKLTDWRIGWSIDKLIDWFGRLIDEIDVYFGGQSSTTTATWFDVAGQKEKSALQSVMTSVVMTSRSTRCATFSQILTCIGLPGSSHGSAAAGNKIRRCVVFFNLSYSYWFLQTLRAVYLNHITTTKRQIIHTSTLYGTNYPISMHH